MKKLYYILLLAVAMLTFTSWANDSFSQDRNPGESTIIKDEVDDSEEENEAGGNKVDCSKKTGYFGECRRIRILIPGVDGPYTDRPEAICEPVKDPSQSCSMLNYTWMNLAFVLGHSAMN